jgi:hypothetical protein
MQVLSLLIGYWYVYRVVTLMLIVVRLLDAIVLRRILLYQYQ